MGDGKKAFVTNPAKAEAGRPSEACREAAWRLREHSAGAKAAWR